MTCMNCGLPLDDPNESLFEGLAVKNLYGSFCTQWCLDTWELIHSEDIREDARSRAACSDHRLGD